ncbi:ATP-binding protein [Streptomyces sp. CA-294286]|uniref:ATP-binding protein n=1 Tax=Streptomyces sp. CA-294286 TaxID=3240070 RepID=UPI003D93ABC1
MQVLQMQLEVGADPAEVGRARRWARSRLAGAGIAVDESLAETLILLISELVTNAVVHTGCPAVLRMLFPGDEADAADGDSGSVRAEPGAGPAPCPGPGAGSGPVPAAGAGPEAVSCGGTVRVEVADVSACPPRPRHAEGDDTNGRGLELVDGLADRWGWQVEGAGKRIWCEVDRRTEPAGGALADHPEAGLYEPSCAVTHLA